MENKILFAHKEEFYQWLLENHSICNEVWVVYSKKKELRAITYEESVEVAMCFGWVDVIIKRIDEQSYMRRFTPRKLNSSWSEKNKRLAERLLDEGMMHESGIKAIENAIRLGNWDKNNRLEITTEEILKFETLLKAHDFAFNNYSRMAPSHKRQYQVYYYHAKLQETRNKRFLKILDTLENRKEFVWAPVKDEK